MRAIWKGSIAFGLVHIPVNLYPATETQSISSNLLHKKDHSRIRYQRISEATGKEVPAEEIVRGYELERDNFVVISDDELKEASPCCPRCSTSMLKRPVVKFRLALCTWRKA
jgi:DNA end-binding protein Ku